jgi:hypothetical protein
VVPFPGTKERLASEEHFMFSDQPENPTIETVINRRVRDNVLVRSSDEPLDVRNEHRLATVLSRTAMNLCLMMTHYGHSLGGPLDPAQLLVGGDDDGSGQSVGNNWQPR